MKRILFVLLLFLATLTLALEPIRIKSGDYLYHKKRFLRKNLFIKYDKIAYNPGDSLIYLIFKTNTGKFCRRVKFKKLFIRFEPLDTLVGIVYVAEPINLESNSFTFVVWRNATGEAKDNFLLAYKKP